MGKGEETIDKLKSGGKILDVIISVPEAPVSSFLSNHVGVDVNQFIVNQRNKRLKVQVFEIKEDVKKN